jgi:hypothetical protein
MGWTFRPTTHHADEKDLLKCNFLKLSLPCTHCYNNMYLHQLVRKFKIKCVENFTRAPTCFAVLNTSSSPQHTEHLKYTSPVTETVKKPVYDAVCWGIMSFFVLFLVMEAPVEWNWQGKTEELGGKTCSSATLSTTNPTGLTPGSNPGLRGGRPATNRLSHGTAEALCQSGIFFYTFHSNFVCEFLKMHVGVLKCWIINYISTDKVVSVFI